MPRFVDSSVGGRTLTIPDAADRFTSPGNMADGTSRLGVGMNTALSPTYGHCYDRAAGAADYVLAEGQPKTIVVWLNWWEVGSFGKMGVCEANTPTTGDNWAIDRNSGSGRRQFQVFNSSGGSSQVNAGAAGTGTNGIVEMVALTWTGVGGASNNLRAFGEGAFVQAATMGTIKTPPTTPQLWFGRKANIALGSFSPTTNAASPNSGVCEMAKLTVFDRVLTDSEIADLYVAMTVPGPQPPAFREADIDTPSTASTFNYSNASAIGDVSVALASFTNTGTPSSAIDWDDLVVIDEQSGTGLGTTFSHPWNLQAATKTLDSTPDSITLTFTGGSNSTGVLTRTMFDGRTVGGSPQLVYAEAFDSFPSAGGVTATADQLQLPTVEVPELYVAVYQFIIGDQPSGFTWGVATERADTGSFSGTSTAQTNATLDGPHPGSGVTIGRTGIQARVESRGAFLAMWLVPGVGAVGA